MALDATIGGAASDTYATLAEYTAYAAAMGLVLTGDTTSQEAQLRRARMALDSGYKWIGERVTSTQKLGWPRIVGEYVDGYPVASDSIPQAILDAQCEMAYLMQGGADPFATVSGGAVSGERKKVDVIETETTYVEGSARDRASYPAVDLLVAPYAMGKTSGGGSVRLKRA